MNDDSDIMSCSKMISDTFRNIKGSDLEKSNKIVNTWKDTVYKINNYGPKLAVHSKIIDLKNGILLVETDHPGWIQIFQIYKKFIINGLKRKFPNNEISSLAFRVKGSDASLLSRQKIEEEEKKIVKNRLEKEQKTIENISKPEKNGKKTEIPKHLQNLLDQLHQDMLTNTKK